MPRLMQTASLHCDRFSCTSIVSVTCESIVMAEEIALKIAAAEKWHLRKREPGKTRDEARLDDDRDLCPEHAPAPSAVPVHEPGNVWHDE